ncbi:MAG: SPASM domain-containing protein [Candidatus Diapherotrites archaeon]
MKKIEEENERFSAGIAITASALNQDSLLETYRFARDELGAKNIHVFFVCGEPRNMSAKALDTGKYALVAREAMKDIKAGKIGYSNVPFAGLVNARTLLMYKETARIAEGKQPRFPCSAGRSIGVIFGNGTVAPCELCSESFGSLRENGFDFKKLWFSGKALEFRARIAKEHCACTDECFLGMSILSSPKAYFYFLGELV